MSRPAPIPYPGNCPCCNRNGCTCVGFKRGQAPRSFRISFLDYASPSLSFGNPEACLECPDLVGTELILDHCHPCPEGSSSSSSSSSGETAYCEWRGFIPLCPSEGDDGVVINLVTFIDGSNFLKAELGWWDQSVGTDSCTALIGGFHLVKTWYGPYMGGEIVESDPWWNLMFNWNDLNETFECNLLSNVCWFYNPFTLEIGRWRIEAMA